MKSGDRILKVFNFFVKLAYLELLKSKHSNCTLQEFFIRKVFIIQIVENLPIFSYTDSFSLMTGMFHFFLYVFST